MKNKGGRPKKIDNVRNKRIAIALSESEFRIILNQCDKVGIKPSILGREMMLKGYVKQRISGEYLKLLKQADSIANNLNQTVKIMNSLMKDNKVNNVENHLLKIINTIRVFDMYQKNSENDN